MLQHGVCRAGLTIAFSLIAAFASSAQETVLHSFTGSPDDGSLPGFGSLVLSGSTLFGVTAAGGESNAGAAFSINTDGSGFTLLHSFTNGSDGGSPGTPILVSGSTLYGVAATGGVNGGGVAYSMNSNGSSFTVLHDFLPGSDGRFPVNALTLSGSVLYGMTNRGGSSDFGTAFRMNLDGSGFSVLHTFNDATTDGAFPQGSLLVSGSKIYGMSKRGGTDDFGGIFSMNLDGSDFSLLRSFQTGNGNGGGYPYGSLILVGSKLYGLTTGDSIGGHNGTAFSINLDGSGYSVLHTFIGRNGDGDNPVGSLTLSTDGTKFYGTTFAGGSANQGTVFEMNLDGSDYTNFYFGGYPDAGQPGGNLTLSADELTLYGLSSSGGTSGKGTVFAVSSSPLPVPEPGAFGLLALSVVGISSCRGRQREKKN